MGRQLNARRSAAAALALVGGFCASSPAFAGDDAVLQALPTYDIQLCCQLCPEAANPATYASSSYLEDFRVLQQGRDGWLFRTETDLGTHFEVSAESVAQLRRLAAALRARGSQLVIVPQAPRGLMDSDKLTRSEEPTSELQSLMRTSS